MSDETIGLLGGREVVIEKHVNQATLIFRYNFILHKDFSIEELYYEDLIKIATAILKVAEGIK